MGSRVRGYGGKRLAGLNSKVRVVRGVVTGIAWLTAGNFVGGGSRARGEL